MCLANGAGTPAYDSVYDFQLRFVSRDGGVNYIPGVCPVKGVPACV